MKIKNNLRFFLEKPDDSDSYIRVGLDNEGVNLKLAACKDQIWWYFPMSSKKELKRAKRKIDKIKEFVDALHEYIHNAPVPTRDS